MVKTTFIGSTAIAERGRGGRPFDQDENGRYPYSITNMGGLAERNYKIMAAKYAEDVLRIEPQKVYLFKIEETEPNEYGRRFYYSVIKELNALEIIELADKMPPAREILSSEGVENDQVVESEVVQPQEEVV